MEQVGGKWAYEVGVWYVPWVAVRKTDKRYDEKHGWWALAWKSWVRGVEGWGKRGSGVEGRTEG